MLTLFPWQPCGRDGGALRERLEAADVRAVHEDVLAAIRGFDEAEALLLVPALHLGARAILKYSVPFTQLHTLRKGHSQWPVPKISPKTHHTPLTLHCTT